MNRPLFLLGTAFLSPRDGYPPAERASLVTELGYAGFHASLRDDRAWDEWPAFIAELDGRGLPLISVQIRADIAAAGSALDSRLVQVVELLRERDAVIELTLVSRSEHDAPSAPRADGRAIETIRGVLQMAAPAGVRVSLCPREGCWLRRVEDAVRLGMRINRPELGLTFNLLDWLRTDGTELDARLQLAAPRLWAVTISGATRSADGQWRIARLDAGEYDVGGFLHALDRCGYTGPIGLDVEGVEGEPREILASSMTAYRAMDRRY